MASQLSLILGEEYFNVPETKRVRYAVPTYIKFYSIYQYDRNKFTELLKIWLATEEGKTRTLETLKAKQEEILNLCYQRAIDGSKLRDSDEVNIFRYNTLENVYNLVYNELGVNPFIEESYKQDGLAIYPDEQQAEIIGTWQLPIKQRVIIHIRLLRLLRKGLSIKEALCQMKK